MQAREIRPLRWCLALALALTLCVAGAQESAGAQVLTTAGPPFATGGGPVSVAFGPERASKPARLLATANMDDDSVSLFSVAAGGVLTSISPPVATGPKPTAVAFSPDGRLLATANLGNNSVRMFLTPDLTPVAARARPEINRSRWRSVRTGGCS
jgi:DNA-binding beta-propeller fold protein YncE